MEELRPGLHRWTTRHPSWHPADAFGAEVACFALQTGDGALLLVDPLLPPDAADLLDELAAAAPSKTYIFITIGYHVRSAAALSERYGATIHGPETVRGRLDDDARFAVLTPDGNPAGVKAYTIGRPRRSERPLLFPSHQALAFGDALVTTPDGDLRMWCHDEITPERRAFYRERFAPTLRPLVDAEPQAILSTHGAPILDGAAAALRAAAAGEPWYHAS
ncbi:MAG TPA: hypothetical protein VI318_01410 [Baekduia sp.]